MRLGMDIIMSWNELKTMIMKFCENKDAEIDYDTKIMDDLQFDSLAVMGLLVEIEETFGVDFTDLENFEERFNRCGDLYQGILELMEKREKGVC